MRIFVNPLKKKRKRTKSKLDLEVSIHNGIKYIKCTVNQENQLYQNEALNKNKAIK